MTGLQKTNSEIIRIQTKYGTLVYETPKDLTKEQKAVLRAYTAVKIGTLSDMQIDQFVLRQINQALLLLGHSKQLQTPQEQITMSDAISSLLRDRYSFLTLEDIAIVFQMALRGDFKTSPDDVVMVNIEKFSHWVRSYHSKTRAEVISQLKPPEVPKSKPEDYSPESEFEKLLQKVKAGGQIPDSEWVCQTAQHYERLNKEKSYYLTPDQRKEIYRQEREKLKQEGQENNLQRRKDTRFAFLAFMEGQTGDNKYEKEVIANCKIRVFREYVEQLAKQ